VFVWFLVSLAGRSFSPYQIAQLARSKSDDVTAATTVEAARAVEADLLAEAAADEGNAHVDTTAFISLNTMDTAGLQVRKRLSFCRRFIDY
jgi:hypothetical protein